MLLVLILGWGTTVVFLIFSSWYHHSRWTISVLNKYVLMISTPPPPSRLLLPHLISLYLRFNSNHLRCNLIRLPLQGHQV
jgi:hypothetical protein